MYIKWYILKWKYVLISFLIWNINTNSLTIQSHVHVSAAIIKQQQQIIFLLRHMHVFAFKSTLKSYLVCETWCIVGPFSPVFCQPITVSIARLYRRSWNKNDTVITLGIIGVVWDHKSILQIFIKTPSTPSHIGDRFKDKWTTFV